MNRVVISGLPDNSTDAATEPAASRLLSNKAPNKCVCRGVPYNKRNVCNELCAIKKLVHKQTVCKFTGCEQPATETGIEEVVVTVHTQLLVDKSSNLFA